MGWDMGLDLDLLDEQFLPDEPATPLAPEHFEAEQSTSLEGSPTKKPRRSRATKTDEEGIQRVKGHWSFLEKKLYHLFLEKYHAHFLQKQMRRTDKVFKKMALFIGTRAADQCRSHHQKS